MFRVILLAVTACAISALGTSSARADDSPVYTLAPLAGMAPVVSCESLGNVELAPATGAATKQSAQVVSGPHPYCRITGTIAPTVGFEVRLPLAGWTQRFLQTGCGGLCGGTAIRPEQAFGCTPVTDGSIALASTDMGHQGMDPAWGEDAQKRIDFAHRGVHVTTLAAKALIRAYYGQAQRYAYFAGCSDGGREALMAAQRYPEDFDGVAAGAPALNFTVQNSFHHGWLTRANTAVDGKALINPVDLQPLHDAVLKACDGLDGLVDGQITDPRACRYDPAPLLCRHEYLAGSCLTAAQIAAVRKIYAGATGPRGERLEVGAIMRGSELFWPGVFVPSKPGGPLMSAAFALDTVNHLLFTPNPHQPYTIASFPFDAAMFARLEPARRLYNADDPNLTPFAAHGGKLILWHGWSDHHISPINSIDYYERVGMAIGRAARDKSVRLFLFPGMAHCRGGDGPSEFPMLAALMSWVETGQAPHVLIARRGAAGAISPAGPALPPRSRPVYAYPAAARYSGKGSVDDAASFIAVTPARQPGKFRWIGVPR